MSDFAEATNVPRRGRTEIPVEGAGGALTAPGSEVQVDTQLADAIATGCDLESLLSRILSGAVRLAEAELGLIVVALRDAPGREVVSVAGTDEVAVGEWLPVTKGLRLAADRPVTTMDASKERRMGLRAIGEKLGARGIAVVALRHSRGLLGNLVVGRREPWRCRKHRILVRHACYASIAIQIAQLKSEIQPNGAPAILSEVPRVIPSQPAAASSAASRGWGRRKGPLHVTPREEEVLELLIDGRTYKEIGSALDISPRTVEHYVERLKVRFNQPRLAALTSFVAAKKLIPST